MIESNSRRNSYRQVDELLGSGLRPDTSTCPWVSLHSAILEHVKPQSAYQQLLAETMAEEWWRSRRYVHLITATLHHTAWLRRRTDTHP